MRNVPVYTLCSMLEQGLQHLTALLSLPCQDQEADHALGVKIYLVPSQQQQ